MGESLDLIQQRVGLRIKELRHSKGYSQETLAAEAGLDRTYINSVENGRRNISINSLAKISFALDTSLHVFFSPFYFQDSNERE